MDHFSRYCERCFCRDCPGIWRFYIKPACLFSIGRLYCNRLGPVLPFLMTNFTASVDTLSQNEVSSGQEIDRGAERSGLQHIKVRLPMDMAGPGKAAATRRQLQAGGLITVCQEASCPNLGHCWAQGTATFMIMGERCTRRCAFCDVTTGRPSPLDSDEPQRLAQTVVAMKLRYVVVTSVDRDDLKDCGSSHFARCIEALQQLRPAVRIEVLIPDFKGREENLKPIWAAAPTVINHNVETVPSLYRSICPQSNYENSLKVLRLSAQAGFVTKSGIILGLGEQLSEVRQVICQLKENGTQLLTIGQYLQPSPQHAPLREYISLHVFQELKSYALQQGLVAVEAGPLVRSSYHAADLFATYLAARAE